MKVILWIVGIVGGLILIVIGIGAYFGHSAKGDMDAGRKFAASATHQQCEDEFTKRVTQCDGMRCSFQATIFVSGCLGAAKGDIKEYCAEVPSTRDESAFKVWSDAFCARHSLKDPQKCSFSAGAIGGACVSVNAKK